MTNKEKNKLNKLLQAWPPGTIAVSDWLKSHNISPSLTTWYLRSGWLKAIARGAYKRAGDDVDWTGGVHCLQHHLKLALHIGAKSALEFMGLGHYVKLGKTHDLTLFATPKTKLPRWFIENKAWDINTNFYTTNLFADCTVGITKKSVKGYCVKVATPERAIMEVLYLIPQAQTLAEAYLLMENLISLRPTVVQQLLQSCQSIKVKRLFMHLAEKCEHPWVRHLDVSKVDFGKGKRVIAGGGVYDSKYQLSLPSINNLLDIQGPYEKEFQGMTSLDVSVSDLFETRRQLIQYLRTSLSNAERRFLLSIKNMEPEWDLLDLEGIDALPAIQWKLLNLPKMKKEKYEIAVNKLREILEI